MHKINNLLDNLEAQIANYSILNQAVSKGNVGWHIVHSCLVIDSVCGAVCKSDPSKFIKKFSFKAFLVLLVNSFPRGKAKAPSFTTACASASPAQNSRAKKPTKFNCALASPPAWRSKPWSARCSAISPNPFTKRSASQWVSADV